MSIASKLSLLQIQSKSITKLVIVNIHVSCQLKAGKIWRQQNGLSKLQTARGPLIDLPDYSFAGKNTKASCYYRYLSFFHIFV